MTFHSFIPISILPRTNSTYHIGASCSIANAILLPSSFHHNVSLLLSFLFHTLNHVPSKCHLYSTPTNIQHQLQPLQIPFFKFLYISHLSTLLSLFSLCLYLSHHFSDSFLLIHSITNLCQNTPIAFKFCAFSYLLLTKKQDHINFLQSEHNLFISLLKQCIWYMYF